MIGALTDAERREIEQLLRAGHSAAVVARRTGRSTWTVAKVREAAEIPAMAPGRRPALVPVVEDGNESEGAGKGDPWIPRPGYDPHAERPDQARWLALVAGASRDERARLRWAMCSVLGLPRAAHDDTVEVALIADRRTADELARLYLEAAS